MKCITCNQEIPDTSTICPFCSNKVEPVVSASEALGINNVLPTTPTDYKLPKDQQVANSAPSSEVTTTDILPPAPPVLNETKEEENSKAEEIGTAEVPAEPVIQPTNAVDVSTYNIENLDLNANANAQSLDLTKEKISNEKEEKKDKPKKKLLTKKNIILCSILLVVIILASIGMWFYKKQFKSAPERISKVMNNLLAFTNNISSTDYIKASGTYNLSYSHGNDSKKVSFNLDGQFGYDIKAKKVDLIANLKDATFDTLTIDREINTEIYLEDNKAYLLMQNFSDNYIYTEITDAYATVKDVESRFNNPDDIYLFKNINYVFDTYFNVIIPNYSTYMDNISKNEVNYLNLVNGLKVAFVGAVTSLPSTQKIEGGNNVITINLSDENSVKNLVSNTVLNFKNNSLAHDELVKIFGEDIDAKIDEYIANFDFKGLNGNLTIVTDLFKGNLKYISIPVSVENKAAFIKLTPIGGGYNVIYTVGSDEVMNVNYTKVKTSTSTIQTTTFKISGKTNYGEEKTLDINLVINKNITPQEVNVITRNSLNYKYLTDNDFSEIANKISEYGTLGEIFKSFYKGPEILDENAIPEGGE